VKFVGQADCDLLARLTAISPKELKRCGGQSAITAWEGSNGLPRIRCCRGGRFGCNAEFRPSPWRYVKRFGERALFAGAAVALRAPDGIARRRILRTLNPLFREEVITLKGSSYHLKHTQVD
jgi:hypothetical protein